MKLSSITIIGMHKVKNKTYDLRNFNYLYGANGVGKSTVMQAIQLALLGYIPGTDKNKTAIFRHSNGPVMSVLLEFDDGSHISRTWAKEGKDIKYSTDQSPSVFDVSRVISDIELPILNFSEFINMTANKLKDWFINFLPATDNNLDWNTTLTEAIMPITTDTVIAKTTAKHIIDNYAELPAIEQVRKFNDECKATISNKKTEVQRIQSTIQELVHYDDCDTSLDESGIKAQISEKNIICDSIKGKQFKYAQNMKIKEVIDSVADTVAGYANKEDNPVYAELVSKRSALQDKYAKYISEKNATNMNIGMLSASKRMKQEVVDKHGICPYTDKSCDSIVAMVNQYIEQIKDIDVQISNDTNLLRELDMLGTETSNAISDINNQLAAIESAYNTYQMNISAYDADLANESPESLAEQRAAIESEIQELQQTLVEVTANKKYDALMDVLLKDKLTAERELEIYKVWEKLTSVNGLQSQMMNAPFVMFGAKITQYLKHFYADNMKSAGVISASFVVGEKANSFSFGMMRDGKYVDYDFLSSGEKCLYALALSLAIVDSSKSELKLLLVDDLLDHLDSQNIRNCFSTLYNTTSTQILVAGVQPYTCERADDVVIEIGE